MNKFLTSNDASYRLLRTIFQGVIGAVIANLDIIIGTFTLNTVWKPIIVAVVMAILSPVMAEIGRHTDEGAEDR